MYKDASILEDVHFEVKKNHQRIIFLKITLIIYCSFLALKMASNLIYRSKYEQLIYNNIDNSTFFYEDIYGFITLLFYIVNTIFFITFIVWFSRAYFNLNRYKSKTNMHQSLSTFSWFIPIISLFLPLIIFRETIIKTEQLVQLISQKKIIGHFQLKGLTYWWILYMVGGALHSIQFYLTIKTFTAYNIVYSDMLNALLIGAAGDISLIISGVILFYNLDQFKYLEEKAFINQHEIIAAQSQIL